MKSSARYLLHISLILFISCAATGKTAAPTADPYWNDLAGFLAGMPLEPASKFKKFETQGFYKNHKTSMDRFWSRVQRETIDLIKPWREKHIKSDSETRTAFYPFSGADFINLYTFYPNAQTYIMVALEEPGPMPSPLELNTLQLSQGLSAIRRAISTIASENYFQSGIMKREMTNKHLSGTLPVLMIFTARLKLSITSVELIGIDKGGNIRLQDTDGTVEGKKPAIYGCRINFTATGSRVEKHLIYLKMRLHDSCLDPEHPAAGFFHNLNPSNTLIKSAVYLLHTSGFTGLCDNIMKRSTIIIEDDSGIPFNYFSRDVWDIQLFGTYRYPQKLRDLPNPPHQPTLTNAYGLQSYPLPFNFGYGVKRGKGQSNLLLATKRANILQK